MYAALSVLTVLCAWTEAKLYVPKVEVSYRALGEVLMDGSVILAFEENYDRGAHLASFWSSVSGTNSTILEYLYPGYVQSFQFDPTVGTCSRPLPGDWDESGIGSGLRPSRQTPGGQIVFPLRELLTLREKDLVHNGWGRPVQLFRGYPANKFTFQAFGGNETLLVDAYWTDSESGPNMSSKKEIPLGFVVERRSSTADEPVVHIVNVYYFAREEVNRNLLQPVRGIHCPDRRDPTPFPDPTRYQNLAWSAEYVWAENELVTTVDAWLNGRNKFFRADFQILDPKKGLAYESVSMTVLFDQDAVFWLSRNGSRECRVSSLRSESYYPQLVLDPRDPLGWSPEVFFRGINNTFVRTGQTTERGVPCGVYQALRRDWPPDSKGKVTSVWEWCFANNLLPEVSLSKNQLPLVSLNIYVKESPDASRENGKVHAGQHMSYHFYNVRQMEPDYMDALVFDISPCFEAVRKTTVTFLVELTASQRRAVVKEETDLVLVSLWRAAVYKATQLPPESLRVSNVRMSMDGEDSPLRVQVVLLDRHPDLPVRSGISLGLAKENLRRAVDRGQLAVKHGQEPLTAKPMSMSDAEDDEERRSPPPAYFRAQEDLAERERGRKGAEAVPTWTPWLVALVSLQLGAGLPVLFGVVLAKRRRAAERQGSSSTRT